ncbi:hypothetical protein KKG90_02440 [Candidatus Bipolaricaulota bacterium]|nr:hypothetical protein [Candidatus Bipolaricaulota bacterium]
MKKVVLCVIIGLLVFSVMGLPNTADCGCGTPAAASEASDSNENQCPDKQDDELLQFDTTEAMEWQCIYWYECVEYETRDCDPCYSLCMIGCIPACAAGGFWWGVGCAIGCPWICEACPDCEYCTDWEQQHSCGWVFTE